MRRLTALGAAVLLTAGCSSPDDGAMPLGFSRASVEAQRALERRVIERADSGRVRELHRELTRLPHPAGSIRDRQLAGWIARQYTEAGLDDVRITTHEVLLPRPLEVSVEMTQPHTWRAEMRDATDGAPGPTSPSPREMLPYHAFSASGEVSAPVVYAGPGTPADYEWLARRGVDVKGRIVLVHSTGVYRYRGLAAFTAQQFGAAAVLMFTVREKAASATSPPGHDATAMAGIERGSILYDFFYPGDPQTPGWASVPGARRLPRSEVANAPSHHQRADLRRRRAADPVDSRGPGCTGMVGARCGARPRRTGCGTGSGQSADRRHGPAGLDGDRNPSRTRGA